MPWRFCTMGSVAPRIRVDSSLFSLLKYSVKKGRRSLRVKSTYTGRLMPRSCEISASCARSLRADGLADPSRKKHELGRGSDGGENPLTVGRQIANTAFS